MFLVTLAAQADAPSGSILKSIPHDGSAIVIYLLMALFVGIIWTGSRKRS